MKKVKKSKYKRFKGEVGNAKLDVRGYFSGESQVGTMEDSLQ
jgi:hypothetical protein